MTLSRLAGHKLVRVHEMTLFDASFAPLLEDASLPRLKQRIARAHRLHEKYRDMAEQQRGEARGKREPMGAHAATGNARTLEKETLFAEVAARLEGEMAKRTAAASTHEGGDRGSPARAAKAPATDRKPARGTAGESLDSAAARGITTQLARSKSRASARKAESMHSESARSAMLSSRQGEVAHLAHGAARGRHVQAKRDRSNG